MKILKSESFRDENDLTKFVNKNKIMREDILTITVERMFYFLFYYAEE